MSQLRTSGGMGLTEAKHEVDGLLNGKNIRLRLEDEATALAFKNDAEDLGAMCMIEDSLGGRARS
jgi:hypothetical protein